MTQEKYSGAFPTFTSKVKIGQAKHDERGKIRGGKVGDQTGHEVSVDNYTYNKKKGKWNHWTFVARPKSEIVAKQMAKEMIEICNSPKVGYNQKPSGGRSSLYKRLKAVNWVVNKIKKTDTSCTPLVCACINSAGVSIATSIDASSLKSAIKKTGEFTIYTSGAYTSKSTNLKVGDVLNSGRHSAMVVAMAKNYLSKGDKGSEVTKLQKFLKWAGFDCGTADGDFGDKTVNAVKAFQTKVGLTTNGEFGEKSLAKAKEYTIEVQPTKKPYGGTFPKLPARRYFKRGDKGVQVKYLQKFLNWYGKYGLVVDGVIGSKTIVAVEKFQKSEKLGVNGLFGKKCLEKAKQAKR